MSNAARQRAEGLPVSSCFLQMMSDLKNAAHPGLMREARGQQTWVVQEGSNLPQRQTRIWAQKYTSLSF